MSTPPDEPPRSQPFSYDELADLQAGLLGAEEEERLRMRMEHNPDDAERMLAELAAVEADFPDPPHVEQPLDVPPHVAARWQSAIAREAERRALGLPPDPDDQTLSAPDAPGDDTPARGS